MSKLQWKDYNLWYSMAFYYMFYFGTFFLMGSTKYSQGCTRSFVSIPAKNEIRWMQTIADYVAVI